MKKTICLILACLVLAFFAGCSNGGGESSGESNTGDFTVAYTDPVDNSNVVKETVVSVVFSKELNTSTVNSNSIYVVQDSTGETVSGEIELIKDNEGITFTPNHLYIVGESYTLHVSTALKDLNGNYLPSEHTLHYTCTN